MTTKELEGKIKELIDFVEKLPEKYREKCFEVLLTDYLTRKVSEKIEEKVKVPSSPLKEKFVIPIDVKAFLQQYNVPEELLQKLFFIEAGEIRPIYTIKTTKKSDAQIQVAFRGLPVQSKVTKKKEANYEPLLRGDDIKRYYHVDPQIFINPDDIKEDSAKIAALRKPKIISQRIVAHVLKPKDHIVIMSTIDEDGLLNVDTVENTVLTDPKYDLRYVLAFLNSSLISWFTYIFVFNKAVRTMDFDNYYISKIPIYDINFSDLSEKEKYVEIINSVDKLLSLNHKCSKIRIDFDHFVSEPILSYENFRNYYDKLSIDDKKILDKTSKGKIRKIWVEEQKDLLVFKVDYIIQEKGKKQESKNVEILRCRFEDEHLRKFLFYVINNYKKSLGTGNLLYKILNIQIPVFDKNPEKNKHIIDKIMTEYLKAVKEKERLEKEIKETDKLIDQMVYELYELTPEEISIIESSLGASQ